MTTNNFQDTYNKLLQEMPEINPRDLEVALGVGLGPGIKKFDMNGNNITVSGKDKETGAWGGTIKITGKNAKLKVTVGRVPQKVHQRMIDAFDTFKVDFS